LLVLSKASQLLLQGSVVGSLSARQRQQTLDKYFERLLLARWTRAAHQPTADEQSERDGANECEAWHG
jgi:hypothetical protein